MFLIANNQNLGINKIAKLYESLLSTFQHLILYSTFVLMFIFLITVLLVKLNTKTTKFKIIFNGIKILNLTFLAIILCLTLIKFSLELWIFKDFNFFISQHTVKPFNLNFYFFNKLTFLNNSNLSDTIVLLAFSSGIVCLYLLGEKNLSKYLTNLSIFSIFIVAVIFMVYTTNILVMFLGFEVLFVPTIYFIYSHGYVERTDKTLKILLYWTLSGAFLVLVSLSYIFIKYKTLNFLSLVSLNFSVTERFVLCFFIFLGFGVKVPIFPFHYWLTKIHVEAPAGFSIFLSGFLVKAAIYCFYYFNLILKCQVLTSVVCVFSLIGIVEASIKLWTQTDFKKLIAFATIQEMNLILFLVLNLQNTLNYCLILFILVHGWLSTLMFFLVDIIQKKTQSRNIVAISGLAYHFKELKLFVWIILMLFSGFPLTIKFFVEWQAFSLIIFYSNMVFIPTVCAVIVIGITGFAKQMIIILYGMPKIDKKISYTLSKKDKYLFFCLTFMLITLSIFSFWLG